MSAINSVSMQTTPKRLRQSEDSCQLSKNILDDIGHFQPEEPNSINISVLDASTIHPPSHTPRYHKNGPTDYYNAMRQTRKNKYGKYGWHSSKPSLNGNELQQEILNNSMITPCFQKINLTNNDLHLMGPANGNTNPQNQNYTGTGANKPCFGYPVGAMTHKEIDVSMSTMPGTMVTHQNPGANIIDRHGMSRVEADLDIVADFKVDILTKLHQM
jgi:hypothetical protein